MARSQQNRHDLAVARLLPLIVLLVSGCATPRGNVGTVDNPGKMAEKAIGQVNRSVDATAAAWTAFLEVFNSTDSARIIDNHDLPREERTRLQKKLEDLRRHGAELRRTADVFEATVEQNLRFAPTSSEENKAIGMKLIAEACRQIRVASRAAAIAQKNGTLLLAGKRSSAQEFQAAWELISSSMDRAEKAIDSLPDPEDPPNQQQWRKPSPQHHEDDGAVGLASCNGELEPRAGFRYEISF